MIKKGIKKKLGHKEAVKKDFEAFVASLDLDNNPELKQAILKEAKKFALIHKSKVNFNDEEALLGYGICALYFKQIKINLGDYINEKKS